MTFAGRVKRVIAEAGGFLELEWDGQLKRMPVSEKLRAKQYVNILCSQTIQFYRQKLYSHRLMTASESSTSTLADINNEMRNLEKEPLEEVFDDSSTVSSTTLSLLEDVTLHRRAVLVDKP